MKKDSCKILRYHFQNDVQIRAVKPFRISYTDITYLFEGELHYQIDGTPITLHAGEAIVIPAGTMRERPKSSERASYASLNLYSDADLPALPCGVIEGAVDADVLYFLKRLDDCYRTESIRREEKCNALLSYLLHRLIEAAEGGGNPYINAVKQCILDDPTAHHTLAELAARVHLAPGYLCAIFKKSEGCTLFDYIGRMRVDYAKRLILSHDIPLSDVAAKAGFADAYAFSHVFRKHEGISPSHFKKNAKEKL